MDIIPRIPVTAFRRRIARSATYVMVVLAVLGSAVPSPELAGVTLYPYRIFLIPYSLVLAITILRQKQVRIPRSSFFLALFFIIALGSITWATYYGIAVRGFGRLLEKGVLTAGIILTATDRKTLHTHFALLAALAVASFSIASVEFATGFHLPNTRYADRDPAGVFGPIIATWFHNINDYAFFLVLATIFPAVHVISKDTRQSIRIMSLVILTTSITIMIDNTARTAILSTILIVAGITAQRYSSRIRTTPQWLVYRPIFLMFLVGTILMVLIFTFAENPFTPMHRSLYIRWRLQAVATNLGVENFLGVGVANTKPEILALGLSPRGIGSPHSWYGTAVGGLGLPGVFIIALFFANLISSTLRVALDSADPIAITAAAWAFVLPISTLGPSNALFQSTFWIGTGLSLAVVATLTDARPAD